MNRVFTALWWLLTLVLLAWLHGAPVLAAAAAAPLVLVGVRLLVRPSAKLRAVASLVTLPYFVVGTTEWMVDRAPAGAAVVVVCVLLYLTIVAGNARDRQRPVAEAVEMPPEIE